MQIFIPGSSVKGVFRHALDIYGIEKVLETYNGDLQVVKNEIRERIGRLVLDTFHKKSGEANIVERVAMALSLISKWSWLLTVWGDVPMKGHTPSDLRAVHIRRELEEIVVQFRGETPEPSHKHYLGYSELIFGTTGLRSAVRFSDFILKCDDKSYIKVFQAIRFGSKPLTFYMELLPPDATFEGVVEVVGNPLASAGEVREALEIAVDVINRGLIGFGKRKSAGFGRAYVELKVENA
ncbi:MAG: RAMP superfamily CRISPR-associated protein [Pyrobaculum sp.]